MINILIFTIILISMFLLLFLTFIFKNEVMGGFALILCLFLGTYFITGIEYQTGTNITASGDNYITLNNYSTYSNNPLATIFFIIALYLSIQVLNFRKENKRKEEEDINV